MDYIEYRHYTGRVLRFEYTPTTGIYEVSLDALNMIRLGYRIRETRLPEATATAVHAAIARRAWHASRGTI
jgi:hypothetical protein